jgi:hypothetical protein
MTVKATTKIPKFMQEEVKHLEEENLELKLNDIRKDIISLEERLTTRWDNADNMLKKILDRVEKTNGSVAKVTEANNKLERSFQDHCYESSGKLSKIDQIDEETKTIRWLSKHPKLWYAAGIALLVIVTNDAISTALLVAIKRLLNLE